MKATSINNDVVIVTDSQELAKQTLKLFVDYAREATNSSQRFCAAISRHLPLFFFELLGVKPQSKALPWDRIHLFWVDECCCLPNLRANDYNLAAHTLTHRVGVPAENIHSICSEHRNCGYVASVYEQTICNVVEQKNNGIPQFNLIILDMDADAHVASLFPDTYTFFDTKDLVRVIYFMDGRQTRITLTNQVLRAASHAAVFVSGEEKAAILREVLTDGFDQVRYPIHAIWPVFDRTTWLIDQDAARLLSPGYL